MESLRLRYRTASGRRLQPLVKERDPRIREVLEGLDPDGHCLLTCIKRLGTDYHCRLLGTPRGGGEAPVRLHVTLAEEDFLGLDEVPEYRFREVNASLRRQAAEGAGGG